MYCSVYVHILGARIKKTSIKINKKKRLPEKNKLKKNRERKKEKTS
jgi:hypothetical protein